MKEMIPPAQCRWAAAYSVVVLGRAEGERKCGGGGRVRFFFFLSSLKVDVGI